MTKYKITYWIDVKDENIKELADLHGETIESWYDNLLDHMQYGITVNRYEEWVKAYGINSQVIEANIEYRNNNHNIETVRKGIYDEI